VPARILLCDQYAVWRAGLRSILDAEPDLDVVGEVSTGADAVATAQRLTPDVALVAADLGGPGGIGVTRDLAGPDTEDEDRVPVLVLTPDVSVDTVVEALRAGARGLVLKQAPEQELVDAVRAVAAGDAVLAPPAARRLLDRIARWLPPGGIEPGRTPGAALEVLTQREREVLLLIARGLANAEIAQALTLSRTTVKSHVSHVLGKFRLADRAQAVVLAYETGLVRPAWLDQSAGTAGG
jgi:DNA-binding NarL/FixJ family response regulator